MDEQLDYAEMLEIPVNTVNVVKKKGVFSGRLKRRQNLKEQVLDSVNEHMQSEADNMSVETECLSCEQNDGTAKREGSHAIILVAETIAVCAIAGGIFLTNLYVPNTVINTLVSSIFEEQEVVEQTYDQLTLTSVLSQLAEGEVNVDDGVITFTQTASVYPIYDGQVTSIVQEDGLYTVEIAHTSTFSSVVKGLDEVYVDVGASVVGNIPFAHSNGQNAVCISLYDGQSALSCFTLSGSTPVWTE
jgi:hypothetical protein